jgi:signal transduction histidine kinase
VLRLYLAMLANDEQSPSAQAKIREALKLLDYTVDDLRHIISRLSPRILDELGLINAIRKEAWDLSKNSGMKAELDLPNDLLPLDRELEIAIYRCLQEALHNIAKHSHAKTFVVRLENHEGSVCLSIEDDGVGLGGSRGSAIQAFGLLGMRERIAALGGKVQIRSRPDHGTRLSVVLPAPVQSRGRLARIIRYPRNPQQEPAAQKPQAMAAKSS